mmetsp:Transcript_58149/g.123323  ORF Transcript_58149/g.123323 Transcript_58149/m.123323 type:complete len:439 (+) Transcript_58149:64-1380(+)|eukprot:CAMPEP_0172528980 /NCGR_PEP_ID=MMETSP1067-20121228/3175_1 /TAXON_ID=265564 ORGANISM="Thalassiosira punctigera, Strain Tpunct2005C2" /NCGR_SAMPLE_ID=MMETSP1067 /ASSEMBLY_ACC=CAM_ASM_000444 /LENGTH=438 /DNA_ID=CAMNT_0013312963 /DNA_START=78 /DNA_END=1394 /DNA_ORIENTATION=+
MRTAPDPPETPEEEAAHSIRRLSTLCSQDPPCRHHPPEIRGERGIDPTEYQIEDSPPNPSISSPKSRSSFIDDLKSSTSQYSVHEGAIVPYDPPPPSVSTAQEKDTNPGALVTVEPRGMEVMTNGQEIIPKPPPTDYVAEDMRSGLDHCYVTVPCKQRLSVLFATLRRCSERKAIVICSTWESAAFHALLFRQLEMLHVYEMHENMKDRDVAFAYDEFLYLYPGILFSSEIAMREFDIAPNVDYLIQYEPPMDPTEYIYRMSNAKIYRTSCHKALLFLNPEERRFLEYFDRDNIESKELEGRKVSEFQESVQKLVTKHSDLNDLAWKAFRAFMHAYEHHSHNEIYDHTKIDEPGTRRSFGQPRLPEHASKYFVCNREAIGEKREAITEKREDKTRQWSVEKKEEKTRQWTEKEKTWRKGLKPWATRDDKSWKHTKVHL